MERWVVVTAGILVPAALVIVVTAFWLRSRLPAVAVLSVLAAGGAALGWGGMLLQSHPSSGEFAAAPAILAVLVPAHVRIVLGRFGPRAGGEGPPAARADQEGSPGAAR